MRHKIGYNIVDVTNQLFFIYRGIAPELRVFVLPPTEITKASDFVRALEEKQEVWYKMMTTPMILGKYYESFRHLSLFRSSPSKPPLPSKSEVFFCHQTLQTNRSPSQQPWRASEQPLNVTVNGPQRHYPTQPFRQIFMPQCQ